MTVISAYTLRSARPRLDAELAVTPVDHERPAIVPVWVVHGVTRGVRRARRVMRMAEWWKRVQ